MQQNKDQKSATGNLQSDYAGTNTDRYGDPAPSEAQNNPVADNEAQNVTDGQERMSGEEASRDRNNATEGQRQQEDKRS